MPIRGVKPGAPQRKDPYRENIIWDIVPEKTALLVVDPQNFFCDERGLIYSPKSKEALPKINKIVKSCREHGIEVIWIRITLEGDGTDIGYTRDFFPAQCDEPEISNREGSWGAEFHPGVDIQEGELIITKKRYSAFIPGSSNLDRILRYKGKDTIIVTGGATNVCSGTTAMDAMMLDYKVIFVSDANVPSFGPEADQIQEAMCWTLRLVFAMVPTTEELIEELDKLPKV